jgi:hypothetical protein
MRPVLEASRRLEANARPDWIEQIEQFEQMAEQAKAKLEAWRAKMKAAAAKGEELPTQPEGTDIGDPPGMPRVLAMDATTEELANILASNPRGLVFVRDELAGWIGNLDRYGGNGGDRAYFLEAWSGGPYVQDRVKHGGKPKRAPFLSLAIVGGIQPERLREALAGPDDGLTSRFLYVWPEAAPFQPLVGRNDIGASARRDMLAKVAAKLYGLKMESAFDGEPVPKSIPLSAEALILFDDIRREATEEARAAHGLAAGWHGKTPARALRLALVYELLAWVTGDGLEPREISGDSMARAGAYLDYAEEMFERVTAGLLIEQAQADAAVIARHLRRSKVNVLNERELYQTKGFAFLRDRHRRESALRVLAEAGWIRRTRDGGTGRPRGDWEVNPDIERGHE